MRSVRVIALVAVVGSLTVAACQRLPFVRRAPVWGFVTDPRGIGDGGTNDLALAGLIRSKQSLGGNYRILESSDSERYVPNLTKLAEQRAALVVVVGPELARAVIEVAAKFPDVKFAVIDAAVRQPNVASVVFREEEGAYLGGIVAGSMTKSNKIGIVAAQNTARVARIRAGFEAGVRTVNTQAAVVVGYTGTSRDAAAGERLAAGLYGGGADVVFEVAGEAGRGVWKAAKARGGGVWIFGADFCKYRLAPLNALPDVVKGIDVAIFQIAKSVADGTFRAGVLSFGVKEGAVALCQDRFVQMPDKVKGAVEAARVLILQGRLRVPATLEGLKVFQPPKLSP